MTVKYERELIKVPSVLCFICLFRHNVFPIRELENIFLCHTLTSLSFVHFLFDKRNLEEILRPAWSQVYDMPYVDVRQIVMIDDW